MYGCIGGPIRVTPTSVFLQTFLFAPLQLSWNGANLIGQPRRSRSRSFEF